MTIAIRYIKIEPTRLNVKEIVKTSSHDRTTSLQGHGTYPTQKYTRHRFTLRVRLRVNLRGVPKLRGAKDIDNLSALHQQKKSQFIQN